MKWPRVHNEEHAKTKMLIFFERSWGKEACQFGKKILQTTCASSVVACAARAKTEVAFLFLYFAG